MQYRRSIAAACLLVLITVPLLTVTASRLYSLYRSVTAAAGQTSAVIVIDPGHGGEDGGAVSAGGTKESLLNLEIGTRLYDLLGFLGIPSRMTRSTDVSVYSADAVTVSEKKVSDLRNRVRFVSDVPGAILVSIHQNMFSEAQYHGAQVFYADTVGSRELAETLQSALREDLDPSNHRQAKQSKTVYLLNKITCPGVLIECGFLSNPAEESKLQQPSYQLRLSCSVAVCLLRSLLETEPA